VEKKRVRLRPFRILSVFLGIAAVAALASFPEKAVSISTVDAFLKQYTNYLNGDPVTSTY